ncbi:hypothetical protein M430DRAFT_35283 [Amorphotheca resinae ATCC 22711]|jgi:hypothetical protein|uniref:Uncharacterized protein n=1 Tax=Amorphotheca resinae ATCC 22711 TaxID=857342 RepID=A0A2T3AZC5_AMORE|nr:hypothetical protein M430DRAFT_35283 [Amorphotheca resinae ATCC 22711]PSS16505.1 hypothetical protein M430DRAFT_35283 [Amorphotheca resinae ATCC 22711]
MRRTHFPSLSTTYLFPAILLNPPFLLHLINTFISRLVHQPPITSVSPHPIMESMGPVPGSKPYLDMHADDHLCWRYAVFMVVLQVLVYGRVQVNRIRTKSRLRQMERKTMETDIVPEDQKLIYNVGSEHAVGFTVTAVVDGNGATTGAKKADNREAADPGCKTPKD